MKLYFAGASSPTLLMPERLPTEGIPILESYAYQSNVMRAMTSSYASEVFLDSGAFTAKSKGKEISLDAYCDFVLEHQDKVHCYAALDVIGDHRATLKNMDIMVARGLMPIPTYHYGEPFEVLDEYRQYPYVAIGGIALAQDTALFAFFDTVWRRLVDDEGKPVTKVHGFGVTRLRLVERYPWYSIDSTTWLNGGKYGLIIHPRNMTGRIGLSEQSIELMKKLNGLHITTLAPVERDSLEELIEARGFTLQELTDDYRMRNSFNILILKEMSEVKDVGKYLPQPTLFF